MRPMAGLPKCLGIGALLTLGAGPALAQTSALPPISAPQNVAPVLPGQQPGV